MASRPSSLQSLEQDLLEFAAAALGLASTEGLRLCEPPAPELGDVAVGCHALAKTLRRKPAEIGADLAARLQQDARFTDVAAAAGFVNLRYARPVLVEAVVSAIAADPEHFGRAADLAAERWLIEYSGPNTNKPLHIGHLRNTILGAALSRLVALFGHEVLRYNIINDRGIHICKSMVAYQRYGAGQTPADTGEKGDQFVGRYYSLFARKFAEEFSAWAQSQGAAEFDGFVAAQRATLEAAADLTLRRAFLEERAQAGAPLPFAPHKVKPPSYPALMKKEPGLEAGYQEWQAAASARREEAFQREAVQRFQGVQARRFEAEVSTLQAQAREYLLRWEQEDPEIRALWQRLNGWVLEGIEQTYRRLGVSFDHVDYESDTYLLGKDVVARLLESGTARRRADGTVVWDQVRGNDPQPAEKVLLRADGTSVYITQDLGSLVRRHERHHPDRMIWVVGSEQELHFETLFALVDRYQPGLGRRCVHLSYGMVELPHGKMKSREGEIIEADGFLDDVHAAALVQVQTRAPDLPADEQERRAEAIALAAVKYQMLRFSKQSPVKFDVEAALDLTGKTGPYCLYAFARIRSILRRLHEAGHATVLSPRTPAGGIAPVEAQILQQAAGLPEALAAAARDLEPFHVTDHAYRLARAFNSYYTASGEDGRTLYPILNCPDPKLREFRTTLALVVSRSLQNALSALGIQVLEEM